jgi:hypothetical protein
MQSDVYHCSSRRIWGPLKPFSGSHGVPYLYAARDRLMSYLFAVNEGRSLGDFSYCPGRNEQTGKVFICERYSGAFEESYKGCHAFLYSLPEESFKQETPWPEEVVSTQPVTPHVVTPLGEMSEILLEERDRGNIEVYLYPDKPSFIPKGDEDLICRALVWSKTFGSDVLDTFKKVHPALFEKAIDLLNNEKEMVHAAERWSQTPCLIKCVQSLKKVFPNRFPKDPKPA